MPANKWKDSTEHLRETTCCTPDIGISCENPARMAMEFPTSSRAVYWIHVQPRSDWISSYIYMFFNNFKIVFVTLWLFNIAMENYQFIDDLWWFTY